MKKTIIFSILAVAVVAAAVVGIKFAAWYTDNKKPNFRKEAVICVYPGADVADVIRNIADSAEVINAKSLQRAMSAKKVAEYMKPGRYVVKPSSSSVYVARMLNNCWQTPVQMTLSGTMRQKEAIARKIANQMMVDSASVYAALCDADLLKNYGFTPQNVFSLFIPDTYEMYWTASIEEILQKQKDAYDAFWTEDRLAKAKQQGLTKEEVSILASIVSGETNYEPEMPSVAGVYLNRLHSGMKLQADPTVAYCLNYSVNRILLKHLEIDSPYNTYMYPGLPPGPIAVPSKACLDAVLNPDRHGYLYFCANSDFSGTHKFATSYSEHLKNAREFQAALDARSK